MGSPGGSTPRDTGLNLATVLFDLASAQSELDHPLCEVGRPHPGFPAALFCLRMHAWAENGVLRLPQECTHTLLDQLDHQLRIAQERRQEARLASAGGSCVGAAGWNLRDWPLTGPGFGWASTFLQRFQQVTAAEEEQVSLESLQVQLGKVSLAMAPPVLWF